MNFKIGEIVRVKNTGSLYKIIKFVYATWNTYAMVHDITQTFHNARLIGIKLNNLEKIEKKAHPHTTIFK